MKRNVYKSFVVFLGVIAIIVIGSIVFANNEQAQETIEIVSEKTIIPGGQSVGIKMDVKGVLIVGLEEIETEEGIVNPGLEAGLQIGDIIVSINGQDVYYAYEVTNIVKESDGTMDITVSRGGNLLSYNIKAAKDYLSKEYKLGIWVKEKIAGIGTLTFYDPETNTYAALGHGIYERKTNILVEVGGGELLKTEVNSIKEGESGKPGEIRGVFYDQDLPLGKIYKNSEYGIFALGVNADTFNMAEPMVIGSMEQVKNGNAYILTTIEGEKVEKFEIEITKINKQDVPSTKGIEIKVIDKKLLESCGGIIQGMSGSPIIQDGKIIGAVTHVLVNDPTRGYGIFIENMISE